MIITRMDAWTAAGRGVERLVDAVNAGVPLHSPVEGLPVPIAALTGAPDVETLLDEVVRAVVPAGPCGLVVGTSSGAISGAFERSMREPPAWLPQHTWRQAPTLAVAARHGLSPATTVSVACASSTLTFLVAEAWIRSGRCDRVIVAGVDAHSTFIHAGFASLGALGPRGCRPFSPDRDGILLGEGAAAFLVEREGPGLATILGVGTSQDAWHLLAPDPTGDGFARAVRIALGRAGRAPEEVDAVSAHGTGTQQNDAAEERAWTGVFGGPAPLHAIKGIVGHCLGAAGAVEAALVVAGLGGAEVPGARGPIRTAISANAAFGGVNAAVVLGHGDAPPREGHAPACPGTHIDEGRLPPLEELWPGAPPAVGRADAYARAGVLALRGESAETIVYANEEGCRAADERYYRSILERGPTGASRLHFPYTIPGAPVALGSIAHGRKGPAIVLCDTEVAGRRLGEDLVATGLAHDVLALSVFCPSGEGWLGFTRARVT